MENFDNSLQCDIYNPQSIIERVEFFRSTPFVGCEAKVIVYPTHIEALSVLRSLESHNLNGVRCYNCSLIIEV